MRYPPLELGQPGREKCPDKYNEASSVLCPRSHKLIIQISVNTVFVQFGLMRQGVGASFGAVVWQIEEPFLPVIGSLARDFDAVRFRNWQAGAEAQVFASAA